MYRIKEMDTIIKIENDILIKALFTHDIFAHDIAIKIKRYCDKNIFLNYWCLKANQGKHLTKHRVPWFVVR